MEKKLDHYLRFYECCIPVKGLKRAVIYDLQRSHIHYISNEIIELILNSNEKTLETLYEENNFQIEILKKQLNYLYENELIFLTKNPNNFIKINTHVRKPNLLEFIYIKIDEVTDEKIAFLSKIDKTGVNNLALISTKVLALEKLEQIFEVLKHSKIKSINLVGNYSKINFESIEQFINENPRIRRCVFFGCDTEIESSEHIKFTEKKLDTIFNNGISSILDLTVNLEAYLESLNFNMYYYQKIFIEENGDILKFYGDNEILGNIYKNDLSEIVKNNKSLHHFWSITKDTISECKACEFRYVCPDNRIPLKVDEGSYTHKKKCIYNPKEAKWIN